ncbi:MAG: MFS transporter [Clostridia bacterium]|nr:MFS transporter [Clostridia bacterium]
MFKGLTKQEKAWVLYDVGNSAFTMLACSLIPIWFKELAIGDAPGMLSNDEATSYWAFAIALVTVIVALLGPILGAIADHKDKKKIFFTTTVAVGVIGCILNGMVATWVAFIVIHVLSKIFYSSSLTFYDSMLNDVTTEDRMDQVSSYGYAWGYIGSCIPFALAMIAYVISGGGGIMEPKISAQLGRIIGFAVTGIWWLMVTVPLIRHYKQANYVEPEKHAVRKAFVKIGRTLKTIALKDKKVLWFLIAFFLYIDGVGTIIDNCINIGTHLGLPTVGQVVFLLATQVVAWIGSLVFAQLSKKHDTVKLIKICIVGYFCVCLYALTLTTLVHFGILAFGVGCFQGSIQSLSRSYYSKIIPAENSGEYFGLYDIFAKGASFLGSALIGIVVSAGGTINIAVASLAVFFGLGFVFLSFSDKQKALRAK